MLHASVTYDVKHPIILHQHTITKVIAREIHEVEGHGGSESTIAAIRHKYWISKALPLINDLIKQCVICTRYRDRGMQQRMAYF